MHPAPPASRKSGRKARATPDAICSTDVHRTNKGKVTAVSTSVEAQAAPKRQRSAAAPKGIRDTSATLNVPSKSDNASGESQGVPLKKKPAVAVAMPGPAVIASGL